ncbi:response regulator [Candidatus Obscuribacterales bacterium]|nr:response regulator [Candidatus Obscuribacterales bacterium]MBX3134845.1 response regulator [Candidatus Obscuribacterales bacterium]MBX3154020.1 response regulator [Candidatus Obscuribacterales bacterium]
MESESSTASQENHTEHQRERIVLLVEPKEDDRRKCADAIISQSPLYDVESVTTGEEAIAKFEKKNFDVVVMSYDLPDMTGDELTRKLTSLNPTCPIVAMTVIDSPELALKTLKSGAMDYLPKLGEYQKFLPRTITTNLQRSMLLENLREMYTRVEQASRDEALLNRLIVSIHSSLDLSDTIERATRNLLEELQVSRVITVLAEDPESKMRIRRQMTHPRVTPISDRSALFDRYHDLLLDIGERRPLVVMQDDTFAFAQDVRSEMVGYHIQSMIMVPLVYRGKLMGLLHLDQTNFTRLWTVSEINLLMRIANQFAIALSQAKLYQIVEAQSTSINKLTDLCSQLNDVVKGTKELTERTESRERVRVKLSSRELEVLKKVAQGLSNKEIAEELHITEGTTEVHVSRLRKKLALTSRAALVRYAYENHIS